jgi:hypothetical protein
MEQTERLTRNRRIPCNRSDISVGFEYIFGETTGTKTPARPAARVPAVLMDFLFEV